VVRRRNAKKDRDLPGPSLHVILEWS